MSKSLSELNNHPHIWRAREQGQNETKFSFGFTPLDNALNGGVASTGLVRVSSLIGIGELSLFKRVLCRQRTHKMVVFINPPGLLQTPWLENLGLKSTQVLVVNTTSSQESLWAAEQCLKSSACHCVILWHNTITAKAARRLQVAATHNDALCLLYSTPVSNWCNEAQSLPIVLDLALQMQQHHLSIRVHKQRHGWPVDNITLSYNWTPDNHAIKWAMQRNKLTDHALHSVS